MRTHLRASAAGQGKEDVVEVRRVHREFLDLDGMGVELGQQGSNRFRPTIAGNPQVQVLLVVPRGVGQDPQRGVEFEVAREPEPEEGDSSDRSASQPGAEADLEAGSEPNREP